jgi:RNA polymerase sigma-70 factor, ECF subfamily
MTLKIKNDGDRSRKIPLRGNTSERARQVYETSDEHLVELAKAGNSQAFEVLIRRYAKKVHFAAYRITENREDAEDVVQETIIRAYSRLKNFEGRSQFGSWFTAIAINEALLCLRRRKKQRIYITLYAEDDQEHVLSDFPDTRPNVEDTVGSWELAAMLENATDRLPPPLHSVFCLRIFDEMSTKEAARTLGLSVGAVKSRMLRANRHLREQLAKYYCKR